MPAERLDRSAPAIDAMGAGAFTSRH
jgi:hypothetical protein